MFPLEGTRGTLGSGIDLALRARLDLDPEVEERLLISHGFAVQVNSDIRVDSYRSDETLAAQSFHDK
jgi:hypothetical protein